MKSKLATITALIIGILVLTPVVFPAARNALVSVLRGNLWVSRLGVWKEPTPSISDSIPSDGKDASNTVEVNAGDSDGALAGASTSSQSAPDPQAEGLLAKSIAMLEGCNSIAAKTHQSIDLLGKHLIGSGDYLEGRAGKVTSFRLELKVQVGNEPVTLLHVCDGRHFWRCESFKSKGTAERIDLNRVSRALEEHPGINPSAIVSWPRAEGLSGLLRDLQDAFRFAAPYPTKLPGQDRTPVIGIQGVWEPKRLAMFQSEPRRNAKSRDSAQPHRLPEHVPYCVVLYLGRDDLFPFRIEYHRRIPTASPSSNATEDPPMVALDFFLVALNGPIQGSPFFFEPGSALEVSDQTDRYLERLGVKKQ
jgi:hypothetical protein